MSIHCVRETCQAPSASMHSHARDSRNRTNSLVNDCVELDGRRNSATFCATAWHSLSGKSGWRNDGYSPQGRRNTFIIYNSDEPPLLSRRSGPVIHTFCNRERVAKSCTVNCTGGEREPPNHGSSWFSVDLTSRSWRGRIPSRRRPCRAREEPQSCTERRRFPLRAYTNAHHDRCRPEVAIA